MIEARVDAVRAFNRFHTNWVGALGGSLHGTDWTLPEARVIWELGAGDGSAEVLDVRTALRLDGGYMSRLITKLEKKGVLTRAQLESDARRQVIALTDRGREVFKTLDEAAKVDGRAALVRLDEPEQQRLVNAMGEVRTILKDKTARNRTVVLRGPRPGELGWIVARHGDLYFREYGWGSGFEALCAKVIADFAAHHDPAREACWIAEVDGTPAGSILCVSEDHETAKIRLLLVEPSARGLGVGTKLVEECVSFARRAGYARIVLWTNGPLTSARRIYDGLGFTETGSETHTLFGAPVLGQTLMLNL